MCILISVNVSGFCKQIFKSDTKDKTVQILPLIITRASKPYFIAPLRPDDIPR